VKDMNKLKLKTLQAAAREATRNALSKYPQFASVPTEGLTLGTVLDGDTVTFELYVAQDRPRDAIVLTTTKVDSYSGTVLAVQVHDKAWQRLAQQSVAADRREGAPPAER